MQKHEAVAYLRSGEAVAKFEQAFQQGQPVADLTGVTLKQDHDAPKLPLQKLLFWNGDLSRSDLRGFDLTEANLNGLVFRDGKLFDSSLKKARLDGARIVKSQLYRVDLTESILNGAQLDQSLLFESCFRRVRLEYAHLKHVDAGGVDFSGAVMAHANLTGAKLQGANFRGADLRNAILTKARMRDACLDEVDLREAVGLRLDGNSVRGTRFSPQATDPWHVLRRKYSGPWFIIHLLLLLAFVGGYTARAMLWVAVNRVESSLLSDGTGLQGTHEHTSTQNVVPKDIRASFPAHGLRVREWRVWQLLLGLDRGVGAAILASMLIIYNVVRGFITFRVANLRDAEAHTQLSPRWRDYKKLYYAHQYGMRVLALVAFGSFLWHLWPWLIASVYLPT